MKKTTKLVALLMALLMVITMFAACGSSAPAEEPEAPAADAPEAEAPAAEPEEGAYIGKVTLTLKHDVHGNDSIWAEKYAKEKFTAKYCAQQIESVYRQVLKE